MKSSIGKIECEIKVESLKQKLQGQTNHFKHINDQLADEENF